MDPDRELIIQCQRNIEEGSADAFRVLYGRYRDRVYNIAYRITGCSADAMDASQETFAILFRKIRRFKFHSRFSSWLYRIAVNASIDLMRRSSTRRLSRNDGFDDGDPAALELVSSKAGSPHRELGNQELEKEVQQAISRLSSKLRSIVVLRYVQGLSYDEMAEVLECSLGTVKSRLARAHIALEKSLCKVLDDHYFE